jgi:deazaflavin-dependent oxidoreductase (nitroreductase family)
VPVPIPRAIAVFNRDWTNRLAQRFAARMPPFGIVFHRGRRTGRSYETPIMIFRAPGGYVVALTYGADSEWVRNLLAAGSGDAIIRGKRIMLRDPRRVRDSEGMRLMPAVLRPALRLFGVTDFLRFSAEPAR